jgi:ABC-type dipeptide/oligopeptide/nickel transport system permease subunit
MKSFHGFLRKNVSLVIGIVMLIMLVGTVVFAPYLAPYDPYKVSISERLEPMSRNHPLGTDPWGRDILSRIIFGGRYSLIIGVVSIGASMILGGLFGLLAGYYSDTEFANVIVWITDLAMAFPVIILGAMVAMIFGPGVLNTIIALAIAFFPRFIRLARGTTLSVKEEVYIVAAKSLGMADLRLLFIHVIPNMISPIIVMAVIWASDAISLEVALSFLGLGVPPPAPSWGSILQDNLRYFQMEPMAVLWPCIAVAWTVQSFNLMGDRFRDILDPTMR